MNFQSEMNKPVFACRDGGYLTLRQASDRRITYATRSLSNFSGGMIKASAAQQFLTETKADPTAIRDLVLRRLQCDPAKRYQFLDGREFTAAQAATEIERNTREGQYFLRLERRALEIIREAFEKGETP